MMKRIPVTGRMAYLTIRRILSFIVGLAFITLVWAMLEHSRVTNFKLRSREKKTTNMPAEGFEPDFPSKPQNGRDSSNKLSFTSQTAPSTKTTDPPTITPENTESKTYQQDAPFHSYFRTRPLKKTAKILCNEQTISNKSEFFSSPYILPQIATANPDPEFNNLKLVNQSYDKIFLISSISPCRGIPIGCFRYPRKNIANLIEICEYRNCIYTEDYSKAHAVSFYTPRLKNERYIPKFKRPPGQIWIMRSPEAASRYANSSMLDLPTFKGQFNWTATYRLDSEIPITLGYLRRLQKPPVKDYESIYNGKKYNSAWFVSHCPTTSRRMIYVKRMMNTVAVHIFGACGDRKCSDPLGRNTRTSDDDICFPMLSKNYFFYLAFENSLCKDYVTEKLFKMYNNVDIIPVVRGGVDYHKNFPPDTFVDTSDFDSPEKLAQHLVELALDKTRYIQMLKAKNNYKLEKEQNGTDYLCKICKRLNSNIEPKTYPDLRDWFVRDQCHSPSDL